MTLADAYSAWLEERTEAAYGRLYRMTFRLVCQLVSTKLPQYMQEDVAADIASKALLRLPRMRSRNPRAFGAFIRRATKHRIINIWLADEHKRRAEMPKAIAIEGPKAEIFDLMRIPDLTETERELIRALRAGQTPADWAEARGISKTYAHRAWRSICNKGMRYLGSQKGF